MNLRRMRRHEPAGSTGLNLVSLMDIFTILVFFLMVNASEVEILETSTAIKLPDSTSEEEPEHRVSIEVSNDELLLQGEVIARVSDILSTDDPVIAVLVKKLTEQERGVESGSVTIMGDRTLPYELLKRVMHTCQQSGFTHIALAVNRAADEGGEGSAS